MGKGFFAKRYEFDGHGIARFLANRAIRIIPVYFFCVLAICILDHPDIFKFDNLWMLLQILCFDYKGDLPIHTIGALWSVSTEFQFYLLAPFFAAAIFAISKKWNFGFELIAAVLLIGFGIRFAVMSSMSASGSAVNWYPYVYTPLISNLDLFLCGMLLSKVIENRKNKPRVDKGACLVGGVIFIFVFYCLISFFGGATVFKNRQFFHYMGIIPTACCLFSLVVITLFQRTNLTEAKQRFPISVKFVAGTQLFGILTYCIYVVQEPVLLSMRTIAPKLLSLNDSLIYLPVVAGLIFISGYILYHLVEAPFEKHKL
jgi:peptidoglycan/LPS O-acetylase OafA/YrhL